jgi:molybdate transport system substrate-binding protein
LVGGPTAVAVPAGADLGVYLLATSDQGDAFLAYCSGFVASVAASSGKLRSVEMPPALSVRADYGLTLAPGASPHAVQLRDFLLSTQGQTILETYGFSRA